MSGIIGIASIHNTVPNLLQSLQLMEQAHHNSCGLVVHGHQRHTSSAPRLHRLRLAQGASASLQQLREGLLERSPGKAPLHANGLHGLHSRLALGYSESACNIGSKAMQKALPQLSHGPNADLNSPARVAVVVHGQLQISPALREALIERDYRFKSNSDVELLAHLINATCQSDPVQALQRTMALVQGSASVGVLFHDHPEKLFAVRLGIPLHGVTSPDLVAWSSDPAALPKGLQALPAWPDGHVLEVHAQPHNVTHRIHL